MNSDKNVQECYAILPSRFAQCQDGQLQILISRITKS